ncbi:MAG: hypothetical protein H7X97_04250 [Opitutaceae bacterium]|nr:hypothetical protein [Verrucomicrobiales bacterium]
MMALPTGLPAQPAQSGMIRTESRSGQFIVFESAAGGSARRPALGTPNVPLTQALAGAWLRTYNPVAKSRFSLSPALLATSCDRIRNALLIELGYMRAGQSAFLKKKPDAGLIFLTVSPTRNQPVAITPIPGKTGWDYRVDLPGEITSGELISTIVKALLLNLVSQPDGGKSFEIPRWFTDGLAAHLQASALADLALQPDIRVQVRYEPTAGPQARLRQKVPLTFDDLSWPESLPTERAELFQDSAQIFLHELMRLPNGRSQIRQMLARLPDFRNWQYCFLAAFKPQFSTLRDVEKWWAITQVTYSGYDPSKAMTADESRRQLENALRVPVEYQTTQVVQSKRLEMPLQEIIEKWDYPRQKTILEKNLVQLRGLRIRVAPEFVPLVADYIKTIESYTAQREQSSAMVPPKGKTPMTAAEAGALAIRKLGQLDQRLFSLTTQTVSAATTPNPGAR